MKIKRISTNYNALSKANKGAPLTPYQLRRLRFKYVNMNSGKELSESQWSAISKGRPPIPPAYQDVVIQPHNPKEYARGRDEAGRLQIIYNPAWVQRRQRLKYCDLVPFAKAWPKILKRLQADTAKEPPKTAGDGAIRKYLTAMCILMMIDCSFRVGSQQSDHTGASTAQVRHVKPVKGRNYEVKFIGKKGVLNQCLVRHPRLVNYLNSIRRNNPPPNKAIFADAKTGVKVMPEDVNEYMNQFGDFTSKYIRTFTVNLMLVDALRHMPKDFRTKREAKRWLREQIEAIAEQHQHSPAICQKSYMIPELKRIAETIADARGLNNLPANGRYNLNGRLDPLKWLTEFLKRQC